MAELKPCPFCGGRPHFDHFLAQGYFTECYALKHTCFGGEPGNTKRISIYASGFSTLEKAIEAWNRRVGE